MVYSRYLASSQPYLAKGLVFLRVLATHRLMHSIANPYGWDRLPFSFNSVSQRQPMVYSRYLASSQPYLAKGLVFLRV